jgi:hypothetical protein
VTQARHRPDGRPRSGHPYKGRTEPTHQSIAGRSGAFLHRDRSSDRVLLQGRHTASILVCRVGKPTDNETSAVVRNQLLLRATTAMAIRPMGPTVRDPSPAPSGQRLLGWSDLGQVCNS